MRASQSMRPFKFAGFLLLASVYGAAPAAAEEAPIRIGYPSGLNAQIPIVMEKAGLAPKFDLAASYSGFQNGPPMMEALVAGQLDAVITSPLPPIVLTSKLPDSIVIVAALGNSSHALLAPKDSPVNRVTDLRGKKIGVSFTTDSHLDLIMTLKENGLDPKTDVELVNLPPNELPAALDKALVDAALLRQPQVLRLIEGTGARAIHSWPFHFIAIMRADYLKANPETRQRFREALRAAVHYAGRNPEEAARWFGETQRVDPVVIQKIAAENPLYAHANLEDISLDLAPAFREYLGKRADAAFEHGFIRNKIEIGRIMKDQ
jgi:ABC-type nitrate/sulfonate/bicarbonate transport system substrate-binding protein